MSGRHVLDERVRASIIKQYARPLWSGSDNKPMRCKAGKDERGGGLLAAEGKIIYDSLEQAQAAADAMWRLLHERRQFPYPCERSKHGHYHLTTRRRERGKTRAQRQVGEMRKAGPRW